jgi:RNA polymerase sigma factor (sigma-70 family)
MSPSLFFLNEDARILDQIRNGDEEALVKLYTTNHKQVLAYVTRNNGTRDDAEDMLQEALVILWERVRTGRYEYSARIGTFVVGTVKNMWLRRLARMRREIPTDMADDPTPDEDKSTLEQMIDAEEAAGIALAITRLGDPCRSILLLYYWEERSMDDIATTLGFANADTVKSKKYQCKKALEKLLKEAGT